MKEKRLEGRVTLITGGGRGLGRAIATAYAQEGARVVVSSRTESEVSQTAKIIKESGGTALSVAADLTVESEARRLIERVEETLDNWTWSFSTQEEMRELGNRLKSSIPKHGLKPSRLISSLPFT